MIRFVRRHSVRLVVGVVLVAVVYAAVTLFFIFREYQREIRIARQIESFGGRAAFVDRTPRLGSRAVQQQLHFFDRIGWVWLNRDNAPVELLTELGTLTNLRLLELDETQISDVELIHFRQLTKLVELKLSGTRCTREGRDLLRKALPTCKITPDP